MILSDTDIRRYMAEGKIKIDPAPVFEDQLGPCSLDLSLGKPFQDVSAVKLRVYRCEEQL